MGYLIKQIYYCVRKFYADLEEEFVIVFFKTDKVTEYNIYFPDGSFMTRWKNCDDEDFHIKVQKCRDEYYFDKTRNKLV